MGNLHGWKPRNADMIIGRTAENKIKIKTDEPIGLRAVECACCNPCGYDAFIEEEGGGFKKYRYRKITTSGTHFISVSSVSLCQYQSPSERQKTIESTFIYDCQKFALEKNCLYGFTGVYGYVTESFDGETYINGLGTVFSYFIRTDYRGAPPNGCLAHITGTYEVLIPGTEERETVETSTFENPYAPQWFLKGEPCIENSIRRGGVGESVTTTITKTKLICVTTYSDYINVCTDGYPTPETPVTQSGTATYTVELSNTPFSAP